MITKFSNSSVKNIVFPVIMILLNDFTINAQETVTDIDGNVYNTVTIGTQVWMKENLKTTRYRNGDFIGTTSPATLDITGESTPKYQWTYNGEESNAATYGRLYTWYAVTDIRNVCPTGWHVPTDDEWITMTNFIGGDIAAQGKLKETGTAHWESPNTGATNESGFTALPGGNRWASGLFIGIGTFTHWWTATEYGNDNNMAWRRILVNDNPASNFRGAADKKIGWAVRCINDSITTTSIENVQNRLEVSIHPNPTSCLFTISFGTIPLNEAMVVIYNLKGDLILSETFQNTVSANNDLSDYTTGLYLVKVIADGVCVEKKILKE